MKASALRCVLVTEEKTTPLANNPTKLRKVLNWLNNFRDVSLAWHVTGTDGYLQALDKFEKTQIDA